MGGCPGVCGPTRVWAPVNVFTRWLRATISDTLKAVLHVTNGDSAAERIRASGLRGKVLAWRDVLHEGPVPADRDASTLREIRADYLGRDDPRRRAAILEQLERRDRRLESADPADEVVLWFEHDLYDQLQLIQILDRFRNHGDRSLSLVCIDRFPGVERFRGLGQLSPDQIATLFPRREALSPRQRELARAAWTAFGSADPSAILSLLRRDTSPLAFLASALRRHLAQFPSTHNGLGRTEQQALVAAAAGGRLARDLFRADLDAEQAPFLGDTVFYDYLSGLSREDPALLEIDRRDGGEIADAAVRVTDDGHRVLAGRADRVRLNGLDRWFGGTHLAGHEAAWRFNLATEQLEAG